MTLLINRPGSIRPQFYQTNRPVVSREPRRETSTCFRRNLWHKQQQDQEGQAHEKRTGEDDDILPAAPPPPYDPLSHLLILYLDKGLISLRTCPNCGFTVRGARTETAKKAQAQQALAQARHWMEEKRREDSARESRSRMSYHRTVDPTAFIKMEKESGARKPELLCVYRVKGVDFVGLKG